jgi:hypothetical protein
MTVKEIAQAVGRESRAVQNWVSLVSAKNAQVFAKIAEARKTSKPADYTLAEVCDIIEAGLGKAAADVYRTNAANAELKKQPAKMTGAYLAEINKAFDRSILSKNEARAMLGLQPMQEPALIAGDIGRISKQAYAVEMKVREKEQAKKESRKLPSLFEDGVK